MGCLNDGRQKNEIICQMAERKEKMKKNIFKKIVASLATVAMAAGIFTAMPAEEAKAANDYYLIGYINGADYGCEKDWENLGEYKFVDGKLTAKFTVDSYVFIKTGDNDHWYLTAEYVGDKTEAIYAEGNEQKMFVPGNKELEFTLVENADGTLKLSYAEAVADKPADDSADKPADDSADKPADDSANKPADDSANKPADDSANKPADKPASTTKAPSKLYVVGTPTNWGEFKEMKAVGNGVFTYTFEGLKAGSEAEFKFTLEADWKGEVCGEDAEGKAANFKAKVGADGKLTVTLDFNKLGEPTDNQGNPRYTVAADSKALTFTAPTAGAAGTEKPGDVAPVMLMLAVAAVAAGMVVASKKKTICE